MAWLETAWLRAVSGRGFGGLAARAVLSPASYLYGAGVMAYRALYDAHLFETVEPALPTVSVGALAVGGAGKTSIAAFLASELLKRGRRPAIVLRGYRRRTGGEGTVVASAGKGRQVSPEVCGDEAAMLADMCPEAVVVVNAKREVAIQDARRLGAEVAILDDGFEYFRLKRHHELVLINLLQFGPAMRMLPAGILRSPPRLLARASQVWFTYAGSVPAEVVDSARAWARKYAGRAPTVGVDYALASFRRVAGAEHELSVGARVAAFCGIGSPEGFRQTLMRSRVRLVEILAFPDHHWYTAADVSRLKKWARGLGVDAVVCTAKDAVRLPVAMWQENDLPLLVAEARTEVLWGHEAIEEVLNLCPSSL
ncbi:MAG: tetraacyldisaccharide 4'-kinase [Armatimonadetes bacterium]|nr:tetraacyldisaccharide 4'-kinase [Armatimonadota bacterium]